MASLVGLGGAAPRRTLKATLLNKWSPPGRRGHFLASRRPVKVALFFSLVWLLQWVGGKEDHNRSSFTVATGDPQGDELFVLNGKRIEHGRTP